MFVFLTDDRIIYFGLQLALFVGAISLTWQISPAQSGSLASTQWEGTGMQINQEGGEMETTKWRLSIREMSKLEKKKKSACLLKSKKRKASWSYFEEDNVLH